MKSKLMLYISILLAALVCIAIASNRLTKKENSQDNSTYEQQENNSQEQRVDISLMEDLIVTSVFPYGGPYWEDGSNEEVENVLAITVKNNGSRTLQYAEAKLIFEELTAEFAFSTLRPGESMIVLEKNRKTYPDKDKVNSTQIDNVIFFEEALSFCEDKFKISAMDQAFNVENISGMDLSGNIAIYYKNKQDDIYCGGITYRVVIEGGIEKDGIKQMMTEHFNVGESEVMFVSYTEVE